MGFREVRSLGGSDPMILKNGKCLRDRSQTLLLKGKSNGPFPPLTVSAQVSSAPPFIRHSQLPLDGIGVSKGARHGRNMLTGQPHHSFLLAHQEAGWLILNNILHLKMAQPGCD